MFIHAFAACSIPSEKNANGNSSRIAYRDGGKLERRGAKEGGFLDQLDPVDGPAGPRLYLPLPRRSSRKRVVAFLVFGMSDRRRKDIGFLESASFTDALDPESSTGRCGELLRRGVER